MIIIRFFVPLLFLLLITMVYGMVFDKDIYDSFAPAFFIQIITCIVVAMLFEKFTLGIVLNLIICIFVSVFFQAGKVTTRIQTYKYILTNRFGILLFVFIYFLIYVLNYGKYFYSWDEFSHWGLFIKEILRTDKLYCASNLQIVHKDYVPAISVFEALFCRLSFRFSEANSYRGIQILQASMLFPLLKIRRDSQHDRWSLLETALRFVLIFGVPIYFGNFYHTIYQDLICGIIVYYCVYLIIQSDFNSAYRLFSLNLSLIILILTKLISLALVLMIVCLFVAFELRRKTSSNLCVFYKCLTFTIPIMFLQIYNSYVRQFVDTSGIQSFGGIKLSRIIGILTHDGSVSYQLDVEKDYLKELLTGGTVQSIPYIWMVAILVLSLILLTFKQKNIENKGKLKLIAWWITVTSVAYAGMMWILYLMAFSEYEARVLASYNRYMNTYLLAASLVVLTCYFMFYDDKMGILSKVGAFIILENVFLFIGGEQLFPGCLYGESQEYSSEADAIIRNVSQDENVLVIACGDSGSIGTIISYRCSPISISWASVGPPRNEEDIWSQNLNTDEFLQLLSKYNYVYLLDIDDVFLEKYAYIFETINAEYNHRLFSIESVDNTIKLGECP